jgi:hypothetical protein
MMRFVLGALLGGAVALGGGWLWLERAHDCALRCGEGTVCFSNRCVARGEPTTVVTRPRPSARRRAE